MKIAFIGTRGIPARYGGFETFAEELSKRLVEKGHEVCVYGRSGYYEEKPKEYLGVRLVYLPQLNIKFFETLSHTFVSLIHSMWKKYHILFVVNSANSPLLILPRLFGKRVVLHVDGLEWKRGKWGFFGKKYQKFAEWMATKISIPLIADSSEIQKYYQDNYGRETSCVSYGASIQFSKNKSILDRFGIFPQEYFLQITRFEPENNPLLSVKAFELTNTDKKFVFVGGVRYQTKYSEGIYSIRDKRIKFLGFLYDRDVLRELLCNCYAYIHGNEVGGTNPALLEAMGSGCFVICRDVSFNRKILQDTGIYFKKEIQDLKEKLFWSLQNEDLIKKLGEESRQIIQKKYNWDHILEKYESLFEELLCSQGKNQT